MITLLWFLAFIRTCDFNLQNMLEEGLEEKSKKFISKDEKMKMKKKTINMFAKPYFRGTTGQVSFV